MKKKILFSPLIIIILIIVFGAGIAGAAILISGSGGTENVNLQKGLVGHWKLDSNAKDATPNSNDGTLGLSNSMDVTSNLTMWFKADAITGLNDGDAITTWSDSSGSGNDITQSTAANKPVYKTSILNSKPVARFDGTDLLSRSVTASNIIGMNAATVFLVMKHNSADTQTSVMGLGDCVSNRFNFHAPYDDSIVWQYGDDTISSISFTRPAGWSDNWHVVGLLRSGNTMTIYNDGVQVASDSDNTDSFNDASTTFNLGDGSCSNSWTGDIAEFLIYSTALSDADRVSVDAYLRNKYSVYSSSPTLTTDRKGQLNKAYSFDGSNDAVDAGTGTSLDLGSGDITLSAWIYLDAYNNQGSLWNAIVMDGELVDVPGPFYGFATDSSLKIYFGARDIDTNAVSNSAVNGKWVHAVGVRASDVLTLYIDGVLQTDTGAGSGTVSNAVPLYFGRDNITSRYFDGSIDDVRIYNRALSATEITALYQEYDPGIVVSDLQKGLVGNWKFNGNSKDYSPYANNGTVTGAVLTTDRKSQANKAYSFDGTNDYISVASASNLNPTSAFTLEAWVKKSATKAQDIIFNDVHELKLDSNNKAVLRLLTGARLGTDMDMETAGVANWPSFNTPTTVEKNTTSPIQGTKDLHIVGDSTNDGVYQSIGAPGNTYRVKVSYSVASGTLDISYDASAISKNVASGLTGSGTVIAYVTPAGGWSNLELTTPGAGEFFVDDIEIKQVGATLTSSGAVSTNFDHIVATYDGSVSNIYINGVLDNSLTQAVTLSTDNLATLIGAGATGGTGYEQDFFNGSIDDVRVYNRALSATEVTALYQEYDPGIVVSDLQKGLVGQWKLDGNAKDSTPYANNGTVSGATLTIDKKGQVNKSYNFNGTSDYISVADSASLDIANAITISMWAKSTVASGSLTKLDRIVEKNNSYTFDFNHSSWGKANFGLNFTVGGFTDLQYTSDLPANTWMFLTATYDGSVMKVYLNGVQDNSVNVSKTIVTNANSAYIGTYGTTPTGTYNFSGLIDDVRIYNRALSATEITALYQSY